jgi:hypothetical protein
MAGETTGQEHAWDTRSVGRVRSVRRFAREGPKLTCAQQGHKVHLTFTNIQVGGLGREIPVSYATAHSKLLKRYGLVWICDCAIHPSSVIPIVN